MEKREKTLMLVVLAAIVLVGLVTALRTLDHTAEDKVYRVSVVVDDSSEDYFYLLRSGIDAAAVDMNIDVHFITCGGDDVSKQQFEYIMREAENNADAIIVYAYNAKRLSRLLEESELSCPLITIGSPLATTKEKGYVSASNAEVGKMLAQLVANSGCGKAVLCKNESMRAHFTTRYEECARSLDERGIPYDTIELFGDLSTVPYFFTDDVKYAVVSFDADTTELFLSQKTTGSATRVFCADSSNTLLTALEQGRINAIVAHSEYDVGYMSVATAYGLLESEPIQDFTLNNYVITAYNMFSDTISRVIMPVS